MKRMISIALASALLFTLCSCGTDNSADISADAAEGSVSTEQTTQDVETSAKDSYGDDAGSMSEESFSFADFKNTQFMMSSGAGGWYIMLDINADGSFAGIYNDSDMGETGEGYLYGTVYQSEYTGQMTDLKKVNDYTYSAKVSNIKYVKEPGTEEVKDDTKYVYSEASISEGDEVSIYLKGAPVAELPEGYKIWAGAQADGSELTAYGLYDSAADAGFVGYDK